MTILRSSAFILFQFFLIASVFGQYSETIQTDRPGQAIGASTVGKKILQVQSGITLSNDKYFLYSLNGLGVESVIRYGIGEKLEVNALLNFSNLWLRDNGSIATGINANNLGMRYQILSGKKTAPALAVQYRIKFPSISSDFRSNSIGSTIQLSASQSLGEKFGLVANIGLNWNDLFEQTSGFYILNLGYALSPKVGLFIEHYGNISNGNVWAYFDGGVSYLLNPNILLDFSAGYGNNFGITSTFVSVGISGRTRRGQ